MTADIPTLRDVDQSEPLAWSVDLGGQDQSDGVLVEDGRAVAFWSPERGWEAAVRW